MASSKAEFNAMFERLRKLYPLDWVLEQEIARKFNKLRKDVSTRYMLEEGEYRPINFGVSRRREHPEPLLTVNEDSVLLICAMSEVIFEYIGRFLTSPEYTKFVQERATEAAKEYVKQSLPSIPAQPFKRCPKCNLDNDANAKFCKNCGAKLS